jgi:hypothetical protein
MTSLSAPEMVLETVKEKVYFAWYTCKAKHVALPGLLVCFCAYKLIQWRASLSKLSKNCNALATAVNAQPSLLSNLEYDPSANPNVLAWTNNLLQTYG